MLLLKTNEKQNPTNPTKLFYLFFRFFWRLVSSFFISSMFVSGSHEIISSQNQGGEIELLPWQEIGNMKKSKTNMNGKKADQHINDTIDNEMLMKHLKIQFEKIWNRAKKNNLFDKPVNIPIDRTDIPFYGDIDTIRVDGKEPKVYENGHIKHVFGFASISKMESGKRIILLRLPLRLGDKRTDILTRLLLFAFKRYKIQRVIADRYFFDSNSIRVFKKLHVKFLMSCPSTPSIRKTLNWLYWNYFIIKDFRLKDVSFNLIIMKHKDKQGRIVKKVYATNEDIDERNVRSIKQLISRNKAYSEISVRYESVKHSKMTS